MNLIIIAKNHEKIFFLQSKTDGNYVQSRNKVIRINK